MKDMYRFNADNAGINFSNILAFGNDIVRLTDRSGTILHAIPSITRTTGYVPHEVLHTTTSA